MIGVGDLERSRVRLVARRAGPRWSILTWRNIEYPRLVTVEDFRAFLEEPDRRFYVDDVECPTLDHVLSRLNAKPTAQAGAAA